MTNPLLQPEDSLRVADAMIESLSDQNNLLRKIESELFQIRSELDTHLGGKHGIWHLLNEIHNDVKYGRAEAKRS